MEQRVPPFRPSVHRRKSPSPLAAVLILLFFSGVCVLLFLQSPLGKIHRIEVTGNRMVPDKEVLKTARLSQGTSFFQWNGNQAAEWLQSKPEISKVTVDKVFPGTVRFHIQEEMRVALWDQQGRLYPVLGDGTVMRNRPWNGLVDRPVMSGWNSGHMDRTLAQELAKLPSEVMADISEIRPGYDRTYRDLVKVYTRHNHLVRLRAGELSEKMKLYPAFRKHPPGTVNFLESTWFVPAKENTKKKSR
ncbi:hypothetical protein GCM10011571_25720 [Marinithermofilum abyssi]|uniref:POTRA domain-containing protein n=1 Tax=Marinithermofilum abyssi TaxID=1571185 RepID=A0A8J2VH07_9BACL|nr:FtsQ-type POTRA domain-containing protein [Marinithermofilum abyssi]GGE22495.1 hypothetical protein GCM10011571_25720 [Marinithermofilum abyssi]